MHRRLGVLASLTLAAILSSACGTTVQQGAASGGQYPAQANGEGLFPSQAIGAPMADTGEAPGPGQLGDRPIQRSALPQGTANTTGAGHRTPTGNAAGTGRQPGAPAVMAATGPGWDREFVQVGVVTNQDVSTFAGTLGIDSLDSGDQKAAAESVIAEMNAQGGFLGRKVKGVYYDVSTAENRETSGKATCAHFTEDNRVVAVLNAAGQNDTPAFRACMTKARTLVLSNAVQVLDDQSLSREQGWYVVTGAPSWTRYAPLLVARLQAMSYFEGWDTSAGAPGRQPVKVGILSTDSAEHRRVVSHLAQALKHAQHPPVQSVFYSDASGAQAAVLRFRSDGITHVFSTDAALFAFMQTAESQGYRPRYGLSTLNLPTLFLAATAPAAQLRGAVGVGWVPTFDVDHRHDADPALIPGVRTCAEIMQRRGPRSAPNKRFAVAYFYTYCDLFRLLQSAVASAGALASDQLRVGIRNTARNVSPAFTFTNGLSARSAAVPTAGVDLKWGTGCGCFQYSGGLRRG